MSHASGTRLGPYVIKAQLGAGGMGEVYRGTDPRLGREVAIKVIAAGTVDSQDARVRFEREARAIAALSHPNICTLFDVGTDEGRPYLVMELLAGAPLDHVLASGPLPIGALVDHAIALADALHAAHVRGIVHRDLKPANVFLTEHGTVKILDFGLATAERDVVGAGSTFATAVTHPGTTLGTPSYMSPEQLRGEPVDARTDLFSLGLVLYEMATGRRAFTGRTFAEVSAAILSQTPTPPASLRSDLPPALDAIVRKALEKDRDLRYQSAADLRADLKRLRREESGRLSATPTAVVSSPSLSSGSDAAIAVGLARRYSAAIASIAIAVFAAAAVAWWTLGRPAPSTVAQPPEISLQPVTFHGQAGNPGLGGDVGISGDGRFVAYVRRNGNDSSVVVKQLSSGSEVVILPTRSDVAYFAPAITPDGGFVDVLEAAFGPELRTRILRVPLVGGAPRQIVGTGVRSGIGWSPDGRRMAFNASYAPDQNSIVVADADGQNARVLVTRRAPSFFINVTWGRRAASPSWSPDGRRISAFGLDTSPEGGLRALEIVEIDADSGTAHVARQLDAGGVALAYGDQDRWVASVNRSEDGRPTWALIPRQGPVVALTRDLAALKGVQLTAARSTGVAVRTTLRSSIMTGTIATRDFSQVVEESGAAPSAAALAMGGMLFYHATGSGGTATYRHDQTGVPDPVVATNLVLPVASPDGRFVVGFRPNVGLVRVNADGSDARVLLEDASARPFAITRDNATLVYQSNREGHQQPWTLATGATERLAEVSIFSGRVWISPGEREVIFGTTGGARVCAFPGFEPCRLVNVIPGPFSADGKTVFAVDPKDPANIIAQPLDGSAPRPLTHFTDKPIADFSASPDGTRMAITRGTQISDVVLVTGLK